jgi:diguanylate cyclase (GGDEF)-like protein
MGKADTPKHVPAAVILEPHSGARRKMAGQLSEQGFEVHDTGAAEEAVELMDARRPVVVVASAAAADEDFCRYVLSVCEWRPALALVVPKGKEEEAAGYPADTHLFRPYADETFLSVLEVLHRLGLSRRREAELERMVEERGGALRVSGGSHSRLYHIDYFKQLLLVEIRRAKRYGYPLSLMLLSVDPYRLPPGQLTTRREVRASVAQAVSNSIRDIDIPVYVGQEKLLVLLPHTDVEGGKKVGRRLVRQISRSASQAGDAHIRVTASIGVSGTRRGRRVSFSKLMTDARKALHQARTHGGNTVVALM